MQHLFKKNLQKPKHLKVNNCTKEVLVFFIIKDDNPRAVWSVFPVQKISHDVCLSVCLCGMSSLVYRSNITLRLCFSRFFSTCVCITVCVPCASLYVLRLNTRACGCKDEVNREPEILTALKVSAEGKGHYNYRRRGGG